MKIFCHCQEQERGLFSISLVLSVKQIIVPNPFLSSLLRSFSISKCANSFYEYRILKKNYLLDLDKLEKNNKKKPSLIYFCNPSNPQGKCASANYLKKLINLVRKYNSILVLDECYIDIYTKKKPVGGMQVCQETEKVLKNI